MCSIPSALVEVVPSGYKFDRREGCCSGCDLKCPMLYICDRSVPAVHSACLDITLGRKITGREVCGGVYAILILFLNRHYWQFGYVIIFSCLLAAMDGASCGHPVLCESL